jgi:uncharacterized small protein (DUF1192 family)
VAIVGLTYQYSAVAGAQGVPSRPSVPGVPGGGGGGGGGTSNIPGQFWVLVQMSGDDVSCTLYTSSDELKKQQEAVVKQNVEIAKADRALDAEIKKLKAQLATKSKELAKAEGDDAKAAVQKEIDDLKAQIAQKQGQMKPIVKLFDPRLFNNRADAEQFMENTYKEAEKRKEKKLENADKKGSA